MCPLPDYLSNWISTLLLCQLQKSVFSGWWNYLLCCDKANVFNILWKFSILLFSKIPEQKAFQRWQNICMKEQAVSGPPLRSWCCPEKHKRLQWNQRKHIHQQMPRKIRWDQKKMGQVHVSFASPCSSSKAGSTKLVVKQNEMVRLGYSSAQQMRLTNGRDRV